MKRLERENIYIYMYIDIEMFDCLAFAKSPMIGGFGDSKFFFLIPRPRSAGTHFWP